MEKVKLTGATLTSLICLYLSSGEAAAAAVNHINVAQVISDTQNDYVVDGDNDEVIDIISRIRPKQEEHPQSHRIYIQDDEDVPEWIRTSFNPYLQNSTTDAVQENANTDLRNSTETDINDLNEVEDGSYAIEALIDDNRAEADSNVCDAVFINKTDCVNIGEAENEYQIITKTACEESTAKDAIKLASKDSVYAITGNDDKKSTSLSNFEALRKKAETEMTRYLERHIGTNALRLLVVKLKWQNQYSYDEKVDYLIGYGAAINKSTLPETEKNKLIDMMCQVFNDEKSYENGGSKYETTDNNLQLLSISAVEFQIDNKISEDEIYCLLPDLKKSFINVNTLSHNIQYINEHGTMLLEVQFQPSEDGKYKAIVFAKSLKDSTVSISEANTGNVYSGKWKTSISYSNNNLTKRGDSLDLVALASPDKYEHIYQLYGIYNLFMPVLGDEISIYYGYSNSELGVVSNISGYDIVAHGSAESAGIAYNKNYIYTSNRKSILRMGFDYKHYIGGHEFKYNGKTWVLNKYDVVDNSVSLEYVADIKMRKSSVKYSIGLSYGIGGDKDSFSEYRYAAEPSYLIGKAGIQYVNYLPGNSILITKVNGQYTKNNLLTIDQLGAGGANTVRGFSENIANGDIGYIANLELYTPPIGKFGRFLAFIDTSSLYNNTYNIGEKHRRLSSIGIGYRVWDQDGWSISVNYGKCIQKIGVSDDSLQPWSLFVNKSF